MNCSVWRSFLLLIFLTHSFWSCQDRVDISKASLTNEQVIDSLLLQVVEARNYSPNTIVPLSDSIIGLSQEIAYVKGEIKGLYEKGIGYFFQSQYAYAEESCLLVLEALENKLEIDSSFKSKLSGSAYTLLGVLKQRQGQYEDAISLQLKALKDFEEIENGENIANVYTNISENFRFIKDFEKAIYYNEQAEAYFLKAEKPDRVLSVLQNRGSIFFDKGEYEKALNIFQLTLEKARKVNDIPNIVNAINNIGASNEKLGKFEIALQDYFTALEIYKDRSDYWGESNTLGNISMVYFESGNLEEAKQISLSALAIAKEHGFLELEKFCSENLAGIYEFEGNFQKALATQKQVQLLQDSLYNQQKFETVNRLEQQFSQEKSNRIIAEKDKAIIETEFQSQRLRNLITLLCLVSLAVLSGTWLLYKQAKYRKEKNEELLQKNNIILNQNEDLAALVNAYEAQREKFIQLGNHHIELDSIVYIRYHDRISTVFLKDQSTIDHRIQLSQLMADLNYKSHFLFSQINQNYIVHFKNVNITFQDGKEEKFYYTPFLANDHTEGRNEDSIKTRKRSGLNKNFEREYQRYIRLKVLLG